MKGDVLPSTVSHGIRVGCWNTTPRSAPGPLDQLAADQRSAPEVGLSKPAIMLSSVDLPQPLGRAGRRTRCARCRD